MMLRQHGMSSAEVNEWEPGMDAVELGAGDLGKLRVTAERALSEQIASVERNLTSIATCASMAPSIGLFGTVWGVMGSFMTMADGGGAAMISSVAPGISGALLTTVLGLLVAIPSGYFYNRLSDAAREIVSDAENFTDELLADIGRIHGRQ